jgi:uncharacterized protein (DUF2141 family)
MKKLPFARFLKANRVGKRIFIILLLPTFLFILSWAQNIEAAMSIAYGKTSPKKGAGGAMNIPIERVRELGLSWSYNWSLCPDQFDNPWYEHVPMVHWNNDLELIQKVARDHPGRYWLVFNEPYFEGITPANAAKYYHDLREAIKSVDPGAKLIVGAFHNHYSVQTWKDEFRQQYKRLYGEFPIVEGWHGHVYVPDGWYRDYQNYRGGPVEEWRNLIRPWKTWMENNGGLVEFWITEFGCLNSNLEGYKIMRDQIEWLESETWITRYAWYAAVINPRYVSAAETGSLVHINPNTGELGGLTELGQLYRTFGTPFSPPYYIIAATATNGGTVTPSGAVAVPEGGEKTFSIVPAPGFRLADVRVDGKFLNFPLPTTYAFNDVFDDHSLDAIFVRNGQYALSVLKQGTGNGTVLSDPEGISFAPGTPVTLTAVPDAHSTFVQWYGKCTGTSPTCSITMDQPTVRAIAVFQLKPNVYTIEASAEPNGSISPQGKVFVNPGDHAVFSITPQEGYTIQEVRVDGRVVGNSPTQSFPNVQASHTISVRFTPVDRSAYSLTVLTAGSGQGTVNRNPSGTSFPPGTIVTLRATANSDSQFAGWSGGCTGTSSICQVTMNRDVSVIATFNLKRATYTITATAGANGTISPSGAVNVSSGGTQTFTITPNSGYRIDDVKVDGIPQGKIASYTFSNVTSNHSIAVTFARLESGPQVVFAVNCAGEQYTDRSGVVYKGDVNFSGGQVYTTTAAIAGTNDGPLYQSERWGNFSYNIPVSNGSYWVTLKFAEIYPYAYKGSRVFDVMIQGVKVISELDVFARVGKNQAYDVTIPVTVTDGKLTMEFYNSRGNAKVNAILVKER